MSDPADDDRLPTTVGHYELIELIGRGGAATVHRARDLRHGAEVALKLLHRRSHGSDERSTGRRFRREVRLATALRHPNVVTVLDCSPEGSERLYLVTELVTGGSLRRRIGPEPMLPEEAALVLLPIARALGAAHARGIVHRDVKPDNILIDPRAATVKLADFGVALATADPRLTSENSVAGSVAYMPPEHLRDGEVSPAGDVWSVGITLHELLAGRRPFEASTVGQLVARILDGPTLTRLPFADVLSPAMAEVLHRCLRPDPAERYRGGEALAAALAGALADASIAAPEEELRRWVGDPEAHRARLRLRIADALADRAAGASQTEGADLLDRALALVPDHAGALALLGGAATRPPEPRSSARRGVLVGGAIALVAVIGAASLYGLFRSQRSGPPRSRAPESRSRLSRSPRPAAGAADAGPALAAPALAAPALAASPVDARASEDAAARTRTPGPARRRRRRGRPRRRGSALLQLTTEPWAEVFLDGRKLGHTPKLSRIELPSGRHRLTLRNPLCRPRSLALHARRGQVLVRHVKLAVLPARVVVRAPAGWTVSVDGRAVGRAPLPLLDLDHGSHRIEARSPAGETRRRQVRAVAGRTITVDLRASR